MTHTDHSSHTHTRTHTHATHTNTHTQLKQHERVKGTHFDTDATDEALLDTLFDTALDTALVTDDTEHCKGTHLIQMILMTHT